MNRPLSWLLVAGLTVGISACDKKERVPLPKTDAGEVKQQAKVDRSEVVGRPFALRRAKGGSVEIVVPVRRGQRNYTYAIGRPRDAEA